MTADVADAIQDVAAANHTKRAAITRSP